MPASFVDKTVKFDATANVLEEHAAGVGSTPADLERYFDAHAANFDTACFTVAEYTQRGRCRGRRRHGRRGHPVLHRGGADRRRGPQGCDILYGVASSLPTGTDLQNLPLNTVSSPIAVNGTTF